MASLMLLLGIIFLVDATFSLKVLVIPADYGFNSRLFNSGKISKIIADGGHEVSFLMNSIIAEKYTPPPNVKVISYDMPLQENVRFLTDKSVQDEFKAMSSKPFGIFNVTTMWAAIEVPFCEALVSNPSIMDQLKKSNFDIVIVDAICDCCRLILDYLDKPKIVYSGFGFIPRFDILYPWMPSLVCDPVVVACNNDKMNFKERLSNFIAGGYLKFHGEVQLMTKFDELRHKYNINASLMSADSFKTAAVIVHADFIVNYPRPVMPHVIPISGLFHKPSEPLNTELLNLIEDPRYEHVVVASFGTYAPTLTDTDFANKMARVLSHLPALIIWRQSGSDLENLGRNTHLVGWFQQAAVLQHPKTRMFITHCGISSIFEAAYNGIPIVAMPFQVDQVHFAEILVNRLGMGQRVDTKTFTEEKFSKAVFSVFNNQTFKKNANLVKEMINHEMVEPEKKLLFWIEHIAQFGASHLISKTYHNLNIFQVYSLDVMMVLFLITITLFGCLLIGVRLCFYVCKRGLFDKRHNIKKEQ